MKLRHPSRTSLILLAIATLLPTASAAAREDKAASDNDPRTAKPFDLPLKFDKQLPDGVEDLKAMQEQVSAAWKKVRPAIVGVRMGGSSGSAVLVKGGYALTAGHVAVAPGRACVLTFPDGKSVKAKSIGVNRNVDGGLMKITDEGDWPFVEMGKAADLKVGQWVICAGHPGGFRDGRPPPVRVGRILSISASTIATDCHLVGGDSGGPLFDLQGRVIGINSRIGQGIDQNMHVNINTFRDGWEKLVAQSDGGSGTTPSMGPPPYLGVSASNEDKKCKIDTVKEGSPADKGGLKMDDLIIKCEGQTVASVEEFQAILRKKKAGDELKVEVQRGGETVPLKIVLGKK